MRSWDFLFELSKYPHRGSATENEQDALNWVSQQLRQMGYFVESQEFLTTRDNFYAMPIQVFSLTILAGILSFLTRLPWFSLFLILFGLLIMFIEVSGFPIEFSFAPRYLSHNVYTRFRPQAEKTIVVSAHMDTQWASFLFHPRLINYLPFFFYFAYLGLGLTLGGVILRLFSQPLWSKVLLSPGLVICGLSFLIFVVAKLSGHYTSGANDNGSGVALTLFLAKEIRENRQDYPPGTEIIFLFTGSEEAGVRGMRQFLKRFAPQLKKNHTSFLILDNLGAGKITFLTGEGMILYRKAGVKLLEAARRIQTSYPAGRILEQKNLLLPTDALPALTLGYPAISFLGKDERGRIANYHYYSDRIENIDRELLELAEGFFKDYLKEVMAA